MNEWPGAAETKMTEACSTTITVANDFSAITQGVNY